MGIAADVDTTCMAFLWGASVMGTDFVGSWVSEGVQLLKAFVYKGLCLQCIEQAGS